jgi:hypothetical protein
VRRDGKSWQLHPSPRPLPHQWAVAKWPPYDGGRRGSQKANKKGAGFCISAHQTRGGGRREPTKARGRQMGWQYSKNEKKRLTSEQQKQCHEFVNGWKDEDRKGGRVRASSEATTSSSRYWLAVIVRGGAVRHHCRCLYWWWLVGRRLQTVWSHGWIRGVWYYFGFG